MLFCSLPGARSTGSSTKGFRGTDSFLKALVAWPPGSTPDFGRAPDFASILVQLQWRPARFAANPGVGPTVGCP